MTMIDDSAILRAEDLGWRAGGGTILERISLHLAPGEVLGVIGPNGAGKSSLLRLLANLRPPQDGRLYFRGQPYSAVGRREFAAQVAYLEQDARVHWPLLARRVVALGRLPHRSGWPSPAGRDDRAAVEEAAAQAGAGHLLDRVVSELSHGERMLVALARLLATRPAVILADEPVAALDPYHQLLVLDTLRALPARRPGFSAIIVLHDLGLAARYCDRLLLLNQGAVAAAGPPRAVLTPDNLRRYYRIEAAVEENRGSLQVIPLGRTEASRE